MAWPPTRRKPRRRLSPPTPTNTLRSYRSALAYWSAWLQLRYGQALGDTPLPPAVALQFVLDHLARPLEHSSWAHLLPPSIDAALVAARGKARLGPLAYNTVSHRLAVLGKWHRLQSWDNPCEAPALKTLLREARKAQSRQGVNVRKKTAMVLEPLRALLATCDDGVCGVRDRALLLLAWSGGGRRRSEVVGLQVGDVRQLDADTWLYALGATKTDTGGVRREKPLRGPAAQALSAWLAAAPADSGPLFRRLYKGGKVSTTALSADQVARIVQRRAQLAGLEGDWAAHSLRSGFVTEAGRQGVPSGEVMAMTEHRGVGTVMGYFQAGSLLASRATELMCDPDLQPKIKARQATGDGIVRYLAEYADKHAINTLKQRLAALAQWHITQGFPDPTKTPTVKQMIKGIRTLHPTQEKQAAPLLLLHLEQAVGWLEREAALAAERGEFVSMIRHRRDIALVLIGFWRGFRGDELARLHVEHTQAESGIGITFYLPHTKGDRQHLGTTFHTPALKKLCPVQAYINWITVAGIARGPVFKKVDRWSNLADGGINSNSLIPLLRRIFEQAGVSADLYSSHSMRRGFATWASANGWDIKSLMSYVGWRDVKSALRYVDAGMSIGGLTARSTNPPIDTF